MVNTDQDKGWGLTPLPFPQRSCVTIVTSPGHVPPIVEPYSPGSATHPVRGQMSHRPLALVTTLQLSASDPNKHWNKLRDGERGEDDDKINHIYSTNLHNHIRVQVILTKSVLSAVQFSGEDVQCSGDFLCILQFVSLLWWSMIVLCGLGLHDKTKMHKNGHSHGWGVNASHVSLSVFSLYTNTAHTNNNSDGELWRSVAWKDAYDTFWQLLDTWFSPFYM